MRLISRASSSLAGATIFAYITMSSEYKKTTKDDIDFPNYCLFFAEHIVQSVETHTLIPDEYGNLRLEIKTSQHPYCSDAFALISKGLKRHGIFVFTPTYKIVWEYGEKYYIYSFDILVDDLPF